MTRWRKTQLWVPVLVWMGFIFWLSSIPGLKVTEGILDLLFRKSAHMFMYFVLTVLVCRAHQETLFYLSELHQVRWAILIAFLYAVSDELHQHFVPRRGPSIVDVGFDAAGIALAAIFWRWRPALLRLKNSNL